MALKKYASHLEMSWPTYHEMPPQHTDSFHGIPIVTNDFVPRGEVRIYQKGRPIGAIRLDEPGEQSFKARFLALFDRFRDTNTPRITGK